MIKLIAAVGKNNELGKDNHLVFHLKADMEFFKETTLGRAVVMGHKTFESLGKPLEMRDNYVVTHDASTLPDTVSPLEDVDSFIDEHKDTDELIYIIGGATIYSVFLPYADEIILTEINADAEADTFFPDFDRGLYTWQVLKAGVEDDIKYRMMKYTKK